MTALHSQQRTIGDFLNLLSTLKCILFLNIFSPKQSRTWDSPTVTLLN